LFSHKALYEDDNEDVLQSRDYRGENPWLRLRRHRKRQSPPHPTGDEEAATNPAEFHEDTSSDHGDPPTEDTNSEIEPLMSVAVCLGLLLAVTAVRVIACADSNPLKYSRSSW